MSKPLSAKQRKAQTREESRALVKEFRQALGLTQEEFSETAGYGSATVIARFENGNPPTFRALKRLADVANAINHPDFAARFRHLARLQEHGAVYAASMAVDEAFTAPGSAPEFVSPTSQLLIELVRLREAFASEQ